MKQRRSLGISFLWIVIAYLLAFGAAWATDCLLKDSCEALWRLAAADTAATIVIFIFSVIFLNSSFYDPYWSVKPPVILFFWLANMEGSPDLIRIVLVSMLTGFWAWRLTFNWCRGWTGLHHEDWRYIDLKRKTGKAYWLVSFLGIHFFPTVLVYLSCLPLMAALADTSHALNWIDGIAALVTLTAIIIETAADEQLKFAIARGKTGTGETFAQGLWKYSRHPNYFGEILFWWGIYFFGLAASAEYWWTIIGPISITFLFFGISVPMMDKRSMEKRPSFREYMKRTSAIIPFPPKE